MSDPDLKETIKEKYGQAALQVVQGRRASCRYYRSASRRQVHECVRAGPQTDHRIGNKLPLNNKPQGKENRYVSQYVSRCSQRKRPSHRD